MAVVSDLNGVNNGLSIASSRVKSDIAFAKNPYAGT